MPYKYYNPNPMARSVGDCTVRAISKATGQDWEETYIGLCLSGYLMCDMPSSNSVWGAYLRGKGFVRNTMPNDAPEDYTISEFAEDNPKGTYILTLSSHVVCVVDGVWYDSWDSGNEVPVYCWENNNETEKQGVTK